MQLNPHQPKHPSSNLEPGLPALIGTADGGQVKESAKDCLVVESYLEVAEELRAAGFIGRIVFASSNTDEYHDGITKMLHAQLQADFGVHAIDYAPNFGAARHSLGL